LSLKLVKNQVINLSNFYDTFFQSDNNHRNKLHNKLLPLETEYTKEYLLLNIYQQILSISQKKLFEKESTNQVLKYFFHLLSVEPSHHTINKYHLFCY